MSDKRYRVSFHACMALVLSIGVASSETPDPPGVIIVSPSELSEAWRSYAKHRSTDARPFRVIDTAVISANYKGPDIQEKIRLCIREQIESNQTKWVILGGDSTPDGGLIPDRDTFHKNMWGEDRDIPTDIYYISPTNWDHDQDGIYGEWEEDKPAISYPDGTVAIGRIPVRTAEDVKAYGLKVQHYLDKHGKKEKAGSLTMTCAVPGAYPKVYRSGNKLISAKWPEGTINFLFNDFSSWDGDVQGDYDLSPANIVDRMNEGNIDKWHLHGHGLIDRWILEGDTDFNLKTVGQLKNLDHLPVITTVSCFTGQFDATKDPCISEAMLRHPSGGAIAVIAPAREGKPHFHDPEKDFPLMAKEGKLDGTTQTMTSFWVAALSGNKTVGEAIATAKAGLADDAEKSATYHQGVCEINLLGDPSLPVR